jgi:tRNA (guanine-N7-)-methyltransferase
MSQNADIDNTNDQDRKPRRIRSYVLRQGRVTQAQKRAFTDHWSNFGIEYSGELKNFEKIFSRHAGLVLEIGFGNGEQMQFAATNEPERDFIGVEVHGPGVGRLLNALTEDRLNNARIYQHDAVEVLKNEIGDATLSEVRIYFPDPWHKKRHHKRRLIQSAFVSLLCQKMKPGGLLHLATDWENYAEHIWDVCDAEPQLENVQGPRGFADRPQWRRQTHFETRGLKLGHGVWDLLYKRR